MAGWIKMPPGTELGLHPIDIVLDADPAAPSPKRGQSPPPNFRPMSIVAQRLQGSTCHLAWRQASPRPHCARWGPSSPLSKKGAQTPIFGPCLLCPNGWMDGDATNWYGGRPRPKWHCVRWRFSSPPQRGDRAPQFSAHVYCDQTAAWSTMPLGMEVGLSPGHTVLDGDPAHPSPKGGIPPNFCPCLLWPNGWMDQDATWYEVSLSPGRSVLHGDLAPPKRGTAPSFWPMSIVAKQLPISATAEHLLVLFSVPTECLQCFSHCCLGIRKCIWPAKSWVLRCWHGYQYKVRCKWFAYGVQLMPLPSYHFFLH